MTVLTLNLYLAALLLSLRYIGTMVFRRRLVLAWRILAQPSLLHLSLVSRWQGYLERDFTSLVRVFRQSGRSEADMI